jgi:hypothetical protein
VTAITLTGTLPSGVTFHDNGDGSARLAGIPAAGSGGPHVVTFSATNGVGGPVTQTFTLSVQEAPSITSASSTTFAVAAAGRFLVTTTGVPTPSLTRSSALPGGVTFTDNGDGTATLAGTPGASQGGAYALTLTATNGVAPSVSQSFTLTIAEAPAISSPNAATFDAGTASSFTVTTTGYPAATVSQTGACQPVSRSPPQRERCPARRRRQARSHCSSPPATG